MQQVGIALILAAIVLAVVAMLMRRRSAELKAQLQTTPQKVEEVVDVVRPRPTVASFHVHGEEAQVTFDVPLSNDDVDPVMKELLLHEAVEVVREKRHTLPIDMVTKVVALAGRGSEPQTVGHIDLPSAGELPPPMVAPPSLHLSQIGFDPLEQTFSTDRQASPPGLAEANKNDVLGPIGQELRLPRAVDLGLRAQGVDPQTMDSGELVRTVLGMFGYKMALVGEATYEAVKGGTKTFLREVGHGESDYPELESKSIREFLVDFLAAGADRGMLVSDKFAPFDIYETERREPRIQFITRERLQNFIDAMALE